LKIILDGEQKAGIIKSEAENNIEKAAEAILQVIFN
jgi:hypothetical protein